MRKLIAVLLLLIGAAHAATLSPIQLLNPVGSTAGQAIVSTGGSTAPAWATVTAGGLTPVGANTVYGNFTAASASPIANAVPSCSAANSALKYTTSSGLSCGTTFALTSGNLSQFAATSSAQLLGVLSDETGSGLAVFGTSPSLTTPTIAGASLSGTFSGSPTFSGTVTVAGLTSTGSITPSQTVGIIGTTTNNNANAGAVGEYISSTILSGSAVSLTTGTAANITSITLTAGDWDVFGVVQFTPAGGTTVTYIAGSSSTTSASNNTQNGFFLGGIASGLVGVLANPIATVRYSVASNTTVYLVAQSQFSGSTMSAYGFIGARRVR